MGRAGLSVGKSSWLREDQTNIDLRARCPKHTRVKFAKFLNLFLVFPWVRDCSASHLPGGQKAAGAEPRGLLSKKGTREEKRSPRDACVLDQEGLIPQFSMCPSLSPAASREPLLTWSYFAHYWNCSWRFPRQTRTGPWVWWRKVLAWIRKHAIS